MWEVERHNWDELRAMGTAEQVPLVIEQLVHSASAAEAEAAFHFIDNLVVVQGCLYEAAPATAACLVLALPFSSPMARLTILELLNALCGANFAPQEEIAARALQKKCLQEVRKGVASYLHLLQYGTVQERGQCVDLLDMCAEDDPSLVEQVLWYLVKVKELHLSAEFDELVTNTMSSLSRLRLQNRT